MRVRACQESRLRKSRVYGEEVGATREWGELGGGVGILTSDSSSPTPLSAASSGLFRSGESTHPLLKLKFCFACFTKHQERQANGS